MWSQFGSCQLGALDQLKPSGASGFSESKMVSRVGVTPQHMSTVIGSPVERGLVFHTTRPIQSDVLAARITAEGSQIVTQALPANAIQIQAASDPSDAECTMLGNLLNRSADALNHCVLGGQPI